MSKFDHLLLWIGVPIAIIYLSSMVIIPFFIDGECSFQYLLDVWYRWQGFNVGILALSSSILAFYVARYRANKQRERDYLAAKAFLPQTLSELQSFFLSSATTLLVEWHRVSARLDNEILEEPIESNMDFPDNYREVFSNCIRYAESDVSEYLARILAKLQIFQARCSTLNDEAIATGLDNILDYIYRLAELKTMVDRISNYARGLVEFNGDPLTWGEFDNTYKILFRNITYTDIKVDDETNLESYTKEKIN